MSMPRGYLEAKPKQNLCLEALKQHWGCPMAPIHAAPGHVPHVSLSPSASPTALHIPSVADSSFPDPLAPLTPVGCVRPGMYKGLGPWFGTGSAGTGMVSSPSPSQEVNVWTAWFRYRGPAETHPRGNNSLQGTDAKLSSTPCISQAASEAERK